jgi:hypothetical protein
MFPPPTPVIGTRNNRLDPFIQAQATADGTLARKQFRGFVKPHIVVMPYDCCDGGVEDGEQA